MVNFVRAHVNEVLATRDGLQELAVERIDGGPGDRAYALTDLTGPVAAGDDVIVNTTAVDLALGTGGWHFVHWNLASEGWSKPSGGHAIKLRYTSLQHQADVVEEQDGFEPPEDLDGMPVICAPLLSQAAMAAITAKQARDDLRIVMVVSDQTALALPITQLTDRLKAAGVIAATITVGQAFGGDYEAVTLLSALGYAKANLNADLVIATEGPGSLGTASRFGFSTLETARMLDDVDFYGGNAIFCVRWSSADQRERHRGLSHHSRTILQRAHAGTVAAPSGFETFDTCSRPRVDVDIDDPAASLSRAGIRITTMGRSVEQDPDFFALAAASGRYGASRA